MIDLHTHSTFSDGSLTPEELAELGARVGLKALALTDHDSTGGLARFDAACRKHGLAGVPGVEISAGVAKGTMHILGYYVDADQPALEDVLSRIRNGREIRNQEILQKLNQLGVDLSWEEVAAYAGEEVVGRPHFAQALLAKGAVTSKNDAFDRYLAKGKPAYADRFRLSPADSIASILGAGGIPVLSHPSTLELDAKGLREFMAELKEVGLEGIETYYSEHSSQQVAEYQALARDFRMLKTGGSDFHGDVNPAVRLGVGFGSLHVPDEVADDLRKRKQEKNEEVRSRP